MQPETLDVALVGLGPWGRNLLRVLGALPRTRLLAVYDRDPARLELPEMPAGVRVARSLPELFDTPGLNALVVATSPESHAELALSGLRRGLHVFVEKPMARSSSEAQAMCETAGREQRVLMVGHLLIYHPAIFALRSLLARGMLGQMRMLRSCRLGARAQHGSAWWSLAPHDLSLALMLCGKLPQRISASWCGRDDRVAARLEWDPGFCAQLLVASEARTKVRRVELIGTTGRAVFDDGPCGPLLSLFPSGRASDQNLPPESLPGRKVWPNGLDREREPLEVEMGEFARAVLDQVPLESDGRLGLVVTRLLEAGERSLRRGGATIELEPDRWLGLTEAVDGCRRELVGSASKAPHGIFHGAGGRPLGAGAS